MTTTKIYDAIASGVSEARAEVTRTDSKAGTLLTLATGLLALMVALGTRGHQHLSIAAAAAMTVTAMLNATAAAVLLTVVRPRLPRGGMLGAHSELLGLDDDAQVEEWQRDRLRLMSGLAHAKHRRVRIAVDLLGASFVPLAVAAILSF